MRKVSIVVKEIERIVNSKDTYENKFSRILAASSHLNRAQSKIEELSDPFNAPCKAVAVS